jgi:hypothetical protein
MYVQTMSLPMMRTAFGQLQAVIPSVRVQRLRGSGGSWLANPIEGSDVRTFSSGLFGN